MNKIYVVMVMTSLSWDEQIKEIDFGSERVVGWYSNYKDAYEDVANNACDIWEAYYQYALLEELEEGLYCPVQNRWWFKYNQEKDGYEEISEPEFCENYTGFTIGQVENK